MTTMADSTEIVSLRAQTNNGKENILNIVNVPLTSLVPYWRNPRNNELAIEKVVESIREYGYQSPIVVDDKMTIIVGHTRYAALKQLGYTHIDVIVSNMPDRKAKEYRVIDNKTSEFATWNANLEVELREFSDPHLLDVFFPNLDLDHEFGESDSSVTANDLAEANARIKDNIADAVSNRAENMATIVCPHCEQTFEIDKKFGMSHGLTR